MIVSKTFYNQYIKFPSTDKVPPEIRNNPSFFPFFEGCLGAVDGTHIESFWLFSKSIKTALSSCDHRAFFLLFGLSSLAS